MFPLQVSQTYFYLVDTIFIGGWFLSSHLINNHPWKWKSICKSFSLSLSSASSKSSPWWEYKWTKKLLMSCNQTCDGSHNNCCFLRPSVSRTGKLTEKRRLFAVLLLFVQQNISQNERFIVYFCAQCAM